MLKPRKIEGRRFISIGADTFIQPNSTLWAIQRYANAWYTPTLHIGSGVYIGSNAYLTTILKIVIEDGCVLSEDVYITDFVHGYAPDGRPILEQPLESKGPVHIGRNCFLGYRAAVMPGVTLGEHCVVATNSVVTKSFPSYSMLAGSPAEVIKIYSNEKGTWVKPTSPAIYGAQVA